jgi:uncharacterized protein YjbJ (UPF0337 family)
MLVMFRGSIQNVGRNPRKIALYTAVPDESPLLRLAHHQPEQKDPFMNTDQVKGAVKEAAGKVQSKTGEIIGSPEQEVKGAIKQVEGNAQKNLGDAKEDLKDAVDKL